MNGFNKCRKAKLPLKYTKLPHNKLLMVLNSLINFCFDVGKSKYVTVNSYGSRWVKNVKDNVISLNKQQIKDAVAYLFFNSYFIVYSKVFCKIIGISMGSDPVPFLSTSSYIFMKVSGRTS